MSKYLIAAAMAAVAAPAAAAPVAASTDAGGRALILVPLSLTKLDDLEFGSVIPSSLSGTVSINATSGARSFAGGVTGAPSDVGKRARFAGAGSPNQQIVIAITPPAELVSTTNPADKITVLGLTLEGSPIRTIGATRAFFFGIGGTIRINANQPEGLYVAPFDVTAVYL
jgi:opacity protein-like surface antigen